MDVDVQVCDCHLPLLWGLRGIDASSRVVIRLARSSIESAVFVKSLHKITLMYALNVV